MTSTALLFDKTLVTHANPNFAFNRLKADADTAGGYFALVQLFVQQPAKLVVDLEHDSHDSPV